MPDYPDVTKIGMKVADDMYVAVVDVQLLREQNRNAQVMNPTSFERLTQNVKTRGALESLPYCSQPLGKGPIEIISGHHRYRSARAAGLKQIPVLVDTSEMTRSALTAKQIAHNSLVGQSDLDILKQMVATIDNVDDLLATGLDTTLLPTVANASDTQLLTPQSDVEWRTVTLTFLPHQLDQFKDLVARIDGAQDLVGVAPIAAYEPFVRAVAGVGRIRDIKSVGTTVAALTGMANDEIKAAETQPKPTDPSDVWVPLDQVLSTRRIPVDVANLVRQAIERLTAAGDLSPTAPWMVLEYLCADLLAAPAEG